MTTVSSPFCWLLNASFFFFKEEISEWVLLLLDGWLLFESLELIFRDMLWFLQLLASNLQKPCLEGESLIEDLLVSWVRKAILDGTNKNAANSRQNSLFHLINNSKHRMNRNSMYLLILLSIVNEYLFTQVVSIIYHKMSVSFRCCISKKMNGCRHSTTTLFCSSPFFLF